jgi:hypothetical protein
MAYDKDNIHYNPELNYCTASPDSLFGVRFNYSCYLHDRQYRNEVKVRKTRKQTDIDFRDKIFEIFYNNQKPINLGFKIKNPALVNVISPILGFFVSRIYFKAVHFFAGITWVDE